MPLHHAEGCLWLSVGHRYQQLLVRKRLIDDLAHGLVLGSVFGSQASQRLAIRQPRRMMFYCIISFHIMICL